MSPLAHSVLAGGRWSLVGPPSILTVCGCFSVCLWTESVRHHRQQQLISNILSLKLSAASIRKQRFPEMCRSFPHLSVTSLGALWLTSRNALWSTAHSDLSLFRLVYVLYECLLSLTLIKFSFLFIYFIQALCTFIHILFIWGNCNGGDVNLHNSVSSYPSSGECIKMSDVCCFSSSSFQHFVWWHVQLAVKVGQLRYIPSACIHTIIP